jgi:TonB family protein
MTAAFAAPPAASLSEAAATFVDLSYPLEALAARVTGTVVVRVRTDASGRVAEAEPLSGPADLRPAVVANVRQWTFAPGQGTNVLVYRFEIDRARCNDDSRSLFRLVQWNVALITACTGPGRAQVRSPQDDVPITSYGDVPRYPRIAKGTLTTGAVVLDLSIDANGRVTEAGVLNDVRFLTEPAVAHVKTWHVDTTSARRGVVVYEFTFDNNLCTAEDSDHSVFQPLGTNHVRLSVCGAILINMTGEGRK